MKVSSLLTSFYVTLALSMLLTTSSFAQSSGIDVIVTCHNLKGEVTFKEYLRSNRENMVLHKDGGFTISGQVLSPQMKSVGLIAKREVPCAVRQLNPRMHVLTCAVGSSAEILESQLPRASEANCQ